MTRDEIVTALRCVAVCGGCECHECESRHIGSGTCVLDQNEYFSAAAFNVLGAMLMENTMPEMNDLPLRKGKKTFNYFE